MVTRAQTAASRAAGHEHSRRGSVRLSSTAALLDAIGKADSIALGSYVLNPGSALVAALCRAAAYNHARVKVRLGEGSHDSGDVAATNQATADKLRASGIEVTQTKSVEHLKAAVVDGVVYLDDRNWAAHGPQTVVADSRPKDVAAVRRALETGVPGRGSDSFAVGKLDAQTLERHLIDSSSRSPLEVESETLTLDSRVEDALLRAAEHRRVRLIVSREGISDAKERPALEQLARNGVEIRVGDDQTGVGNEKFCVAGSRAWLGSANATFTGHGRGSLDWGLRTSGPGIVRALHDQFAKNWRASAPLATPMRVCG
jgi:hypothetical protein